MHPSIRDFMNAAPPEAPQYVPNTPEELVERRRMRRSDNQNLITTFGIILFCVLAAITILFKMWIFLLPLGALLFCSYLRVLQWDYGRAS
mmetsp:Transcript_35505/g.42389  ORF Transcript_35505/g.42389 Transcript_35505/m.42389 type:complete len:90 (+) Transcript_35505:416-685(+)